MLLFRRNMTLCLTDLLGFLEALSFDLSSCDELNIFSEYRIEEFLGLNFGMDSDDWLELAVVCLALEILLFKA